MEKNKFQLTFPIVIGIVGISTLATMTPLLIIFRLNGIISADRVPDWLIIIQIITLMINGYALKSKLFTEID